MPSSGTLNLDEPNSALSAVDSIFGRTGTVISAAGDYDAAQVNNTPAGDIAATDVQGAIDELDSEKVSRRSISFTQYVYVNYLSGDDSTGTGSIDQPYKTIVAAMADITDADVNKPYAIGLLADRQIELAQILVKPYVSIVGIGQKTTTIDLSGNDIIPDPSHATLTSQVSISNLYLGGAGIDWDLFSVGGSVWGVLIVENLTIDGTLNINGRAGFISDSLESYNTVVFNGNTIDSANFTAFSGEFVSPVSIINTQSVGGIFSVISNTILDSGVTVDSRDANFNNVIYPGSSITTVGTVSIRSFRGLPPKTLRTISGGTTITDLDSPSMIAYTPANPGDWSSVPTDVQEALDNLAAMIAAI